VRREGLVGRPVSASVSCDRLHAAHVEPHERLGREFALERLAGRLEGPKRPVGLVVLPVDPGAQSGEAPSELVALELEALGLAIGLGVVDPAHRVVDPVLGEAPLEAAETWVGAETGQDAGAVDR
jgi:hypothetical protein